ncbi:glycoside hydrolase family 32 protein [Paenibacillus sp.]|uniref:glycoside hydrolase family 32 protein n=1 Tax=Paenibacillus sp. TaxID=58172 RepID=UPI002D3C5101|nr:glycoside hydrolase family 32 protein [Paenibacillus sp.]HZG85828.1 glycoside hydrolase family 32 protein [Paenibacillus sp.]
MLTTTSYKEKYRPQFHFSPASAWLNDPNGMVYYEGEYHLFFQHHPDSDVWGPMHWGHAVSRDLVHWEQLPIALKPDDNGYIFSGSAVVDWNDTSGFFRGGSGLVAVFTHHLQLGERDAIQRQSLAYSVDRGRTWTMYPGNPVLEDDRFVDFRDPKVFWDEGRGRWCMVLAAGDRVLFYASPNLIDWTFCSEFGADHGSHAGVWECPDLFELPVEGEEGVSRWVLVVSIGDAPDAPEGSRTQYFVGSFDGDRFASMDPPDTVRWLDCGRDNYAGVTWSDVPDEDGRRLFIGWMSNWKYANATPTSGWRSAMTLPRALSLRASEGSVRLVQQPVAETAALRGEPALRLSDAPLAPGDDPLQGLAEDRCEIVAEFELGDAEELGLVVRAGGDERTVIGYDAVRQSLFIDRTRSGASAFHDAFACRHEAACRAENGRLRLRVFADWSSVEVFAGEGELVMTDLIFPDPASTALSLYAKGEGARIVSLDVYRIRSIWESVAPSNA